MITDSPLYGMRGSGDWKTAELEPSWRQAITKLYPNGDVPITAITAMGRSEPVKATEFNWFEAIATEQAGPVTGMFADSGFTTPIVTPPVAGATIFLRVPEATVHHVRPNHVVRIRNNNDYRYDAMVEVVGRVDQGVNSVVTGKLLVNAPAGCVNANINRLVVAFDINPEGSGMPESIAYDPEPYSNYTQIFITSMAATRTALSVSTRTQRSREELKSETLYQHTKSIERSVLWGVKTTGIGQNGFPKRSTQGIISAIGERAPANIFDFKYSTDPMWAGKTWLEAGEEALDYFLMQLSTYGEPNRMAFVGYEVPHFINKLCKARGTFEFTPATIGYGIKVMRWVTPYMQIDMKVHPLFNLEQTDRRLMLIVDPADIIARPLLDTVFIPDGKKMSSNSGPAWMDGIKEAWVTELGWELHRVKKWGLFYNVGSDNVN